MQPAEQPAPIPQAAPPPPPTPPPTPASPTLTPSPGRDTAGRLFASPFAKTIAAERGIDLQVSQFHNVNSDSIDRLIFDSCRRYREVVLVVG